jgi:hypothetical protein
VNTTARFAVIAGVALILSALIYTPLFTPGPFRLSDYFRLELVVYMAIGWIFLVVTFAATEDG